MRCPDADTGRLHTKVWIPEYNQDVAQILSGSSLDPTNNTIRQYI